MTEEEWQASDDPIRLLQWVGTPFGLGLRDRFRTTVLFGLACVERVLRYRGNTENWLLQRAEEMADGILDAEPHITLSHRSSAAHSPSGRCLLLLLEQRSRLSPYALSNETANLVGNQHGLTFRSEQAAQAAIIRDIYNPFRPVAFNPAWRTSDVMLLAQGIYADRAFDRMPILADALEDAGCDNSGILSHCRDAGVTHVRGCWVLDLVLGKS